MGQLIKLQDYSSRYEQDIFHYPSRFVTLKRQQWENLKYTWENLEEQIDDESTYHFNLEWEQEEKQPFFGKIKTIFKRKSEEQVIDDQDNIQDDVKEEFAPFLSTPSFMNNVKTVDELKRHFLNQLFEFQMKWATSTLTEKSKVNKKFFFDDHLKFFLQRFPDTYLLLYRPVFKLKKASIEAETILISPTDVWCISFVEDKDLSVFYGTQEKFWKVRIKNQEKKIINPMLGLNRTAKIVNKIFNLYDIELPIHKVLLSRNGYIDYPTAVHGVKLIDKTNYNDWFLSLRGQRSPLKTMQLKGARALLEYCQRTSIKRNEWELTDPK